MDYLQFIIIKMEYVPNEYITNDHIMTQAVFLMYYIIVRSLHIFAVITQLMMFTLQMIIIMKGIKESYNITFDC